jgi:hypothetical protein
MNILVISYSSIVIELLKLVFKDSNIKSEHTKSAKSAQSDSYDIIFIDDSSPDLKEQIIDIQDNFSFTKLILIGSCDCEELVDSSVKKPFLPKDIKDIIDSTQEELKQKSNVLNLEEIAKIKELMAQEDISQEGDTQSPIDALVEQENLKLKGKDAKEFLYECRGLTKKELKKLLKGAKVSVKIEYKRGGNE